MPNPQKTAYNANQHFQGRGNWGFNSYNRTPRFDDEYDWTSLVEFNQIIDGGSE